jgi:peptide deformylase
MILPIVAYGQPLLRNVAEEIDPDYEGLEQLISDMWETMYYSNGVGLAAPQINRSIRLFLVDTVQMLENMEEEEKLQYKGDIGIKKVFINAYIKHTDGEPWYYNEGCLSFPKLREDIKRPRNVTIEYEDENFELHTQTFTGITARVIMHEYDHIDGKLFIDLLPPLKRKLLKRKLNDIETGKVKAGYKMLLKTM